MQINSITSPQAMTKLNQLSFKAAPVGLDELKAKQDEFKRMAEQADDKSLMGKLGKYATKAIGVVIAFTAMKICLGKAADMITSSLGKAADKAVEKATEKAVDTSKMTNVINKIKKSNIDKYAVNIIAGGAAVGVAMKEFGLVKKNVSDDTENLVDKAVDKAQGNDYNNYSSSTSAPSSVNEDFDIKDDEFN